MIFASHTILPTILMAAEQSEFKHLQQLIWYKTNAPSKPRSSVLTTHENILILAKDPEALNVQQVPGITSHQLSVIGHPRMNHHSKDHRGEVINPAEKPWALIFRLLFPRVQPPFTLVELCCGTAPVARAGSVLGILLL